MALMGTVCFRLHEFHLFCAVHKDKYTWIKTADKNKIFELIYRKILGRE